MVDHAAISSFPVPFSPFTTNELSVGAAICNIHSKFIHCLAVAFRLWHSFSRLFLLRYLFSSWNYAGNWTLFIVIITLSMEKGVFYKVISAVFRCSNGLVSKVPWPDIIITGSSGASFIFLKGLYSVNPRHPYSSRRTMSGGSFSMDLGFSPFGGFSYLKAFVCQKGH